jgi:rSAM/selenodomain-associated transferase 2/rSAM/selenodomain-associated transferase 1
MTEWMIDRAIAWQRRANPAGCGVALGDDRDLAFIHASPNKSTIDINTTTTTTTTTTINRQIEVCFSGGTERTMRYWLGNVQGDRQADHQQDQNHHQYRYHPQASGDLGDRMAQALARAWAEGVDRAVIVGIDCPFVTAQDFDRAFAALDRADLVLGAARDGGYYLIGVTRPRKPQTAETLAQILFDDIPWSTDRVFDLTVAAAQRHDLRVATLNTYDDIDHPEDIPLLQHATAWDQQRISAIVPTYNEAEQIAATLEHLATAHNVEIILADGGSTDETIAIARSLSLPCPLHISITPGGGRARQCNAAAQQASGEILLFVHADTRLPSHFDVFLRGALRGSSRRSAAIAGAFELRTDSDRAGMRIIERWANWRSRRLSLPYGDQAIFLAASTFRDIGGFPELPIMDDYALVRQLAKRGKIATLPLAVTTSARRWERIGLWKTTAINQAIVIAYELGISPDRLARWYRRQV